MEASEALRCSPISWAKFVGKGYCLAISQRGPTVYWDIELDEEQLCVSWLRVVMISLECIDEMAQRNHADFDPAKWVPVEDIEEVRRYNRISKKKRSD